MIPRVFHQIWIDGENSVLPAAYEAYSNAWRRLNPEWTYRLWNLQNLDFPLRRPDLVDQCSSFAQVADVLRLEILYRHGGVYFDTDFEPLKPLNGLLDGVNTFFCSEDGDKLCAGICGAEAGSLIIERLLDAIPERIGTDAANKETGPQFITRHLLTEGFAEPLTVFPTVYFYPYRMHEKHRASEAFPRSYAVHRWAASWASEPSRWARARRRLRAIGRAVAGRND